MGQYIQDIFDTVLAWFNDFATEIGFGEMWDKLIIAIGNIFAETPVA